ncbi:MAG: bifunctional riboflavin kinase/FAD synthetase [Micrococcaceae bacterium]
MKIFNNINEYKSGSQGSAVAIGNFDGVHRGHQFILSTMLREAAREDLTSVVLTFNPHPIEFHQPHINFQYITSMPQKLRVLENLGVEDTIVLPYTAQLSQMNAEEFVSQILVRVLQAKVVVVGPDFTFGKSRSGDVSTLEILGKKYGFKVVTPQDLMMPTLNGEPRRFSSTWVREAMADGNIEEVTRLLGRYHVVEGEVVHGAARGRELGFPTANLSYNTEGLIPADGVYAGWLEVDYEKYPVAISVGTNPTFKGLENRQVEAHVINRPVEDIEEFNLYGKHARIEFVDHLRGMVAYTGVRTLIEQMQDDIAMTERILREN